MRGFPLSSRLNLPFSAGSPVREIADVFALEQLPLTQSVPVQSTYEIFCNSASAFGDKTALTLLPSALIDGPEPSRLSYRALLAGIHQTANALNRLGVAKTDTTAVLLPGCLEYHLALWGSEAAGIVQPLNPLLSDEKLASLMNATGAKVLIAWGQDDEAGYWRKAQKMKALVSTLTHLVRVMPNSHQTPNDQCLNFHELIAVEPDDRLLSNRQILPNDVAAYFHTGGTTGAPKLAVHTHSAQVFTAWASVKLQGAKETDVIINGYPLFHVAGVLPGSLAALSAGVHTIIPTHLLMRNKDVLTNYWRLVEKYRCTVLSAVPTVLAALSNVPLDGADISTVRYCRTGAAALPIEISVRFKKLFGLHIHESLGMTEMAGISTITPPGVHGPAGCVGFRVPYSELRIVKLSTQGQATNEDMPIGEQGMVLFKSPNVFSGFLSPSDTKLAFTEDGWLITGDLGWLDQSGRLHLSGRSKDLIIRGGHNIDPKVIEDAIGCHPAVQISAAVGMPDSYAGELPVVFVTLVPGKQATEAELLEFAIARVDEPPARPKFVKIIATMPMTNVGKIYKPDLRAMAANLVKTN
jgi:fatty-acyl-CoA synthase